MKFFFLHRYVPRGLIKNQQRILQATVLSAFYLASPLLTSSILHAQDPIALPGQINPLDFLQWRFAGASWTEDNKSVLFEVTMMTKDEYAVYEDSLLSFAPSGWSIELVKHPTPFLRYDPISGGEKLYYGDGVFSFRLTPQGQPPSTDQLTVTIRFLGCSPTLCLFPTNIPITGPIEKSQPILETPPTTLITTSDDLEREKAAGSRIVSAENLSLEERLAANFLDSTTGLWLLFLFCFIGGIMTNLTPCVAPMIPITLRVFSNQYKNIYFAALSFCLGICLTYTILIGIAVFGLGNFGTLMSSPYLNLALAAFMAVFAASMLGYINLTWLQSAGSRIPLGKGYASTLVMGATSGLVAAPCTGPILGALLTYSLSLNNPAISVALGFVYSLGLALPYFILALMPQTLRSKRVSAEVQILTKIIFSALMITLMFYFLRIPFYSLIKDVSATLYTLTAIVGLSFGIYFLGFGVGRRTQSKLVTSLGALPLGLAFFCLWQAVGKTDFSGSAAIASSNLVWGKDFEQAMKEGAEKGLPVFVDHWAEWCEACKKMDVTTFKDPLLVTELNENWIRVKLDMTEYTDADEAHLAEYGIQGLPTLMMIDPVTQKKDLVVGYAGASMLLDRMTLFKANRE